MSEVYCSFSQESQKEQVHNRRMRHIYVITLHVPQRPWHLDSSSIQLGAKVKMKKTHRLNKNPSEWSTPAQDKTALTQPNDFRGHFWRECVVGDRTSTTTEVRQPYATLHTATSSRSVLRPWCGSGRQGPSAPLTPTVVWPAVYC